MTNIYIKLNNARKAFHSQELKKSGHNKFAGYYYFELGDFLVPALSIFDQCGLIGMVSFGKDVATLEIIDCDNPQERIQFTSPMSSAALKGCHEVQNLGAVQTYLRRYLWVAALEIVEHDAVDSSKPLEKVEKNLRMPALDGIGDDLPRETREFLEDVALATADLVDQGKVIEALEMIRSHQLEGDEKIYLDRKLHSKVRSALRKASQETK